ncbi:MAG: PqqD family protein [Clostridia bacterium]|nr:PqqD family protein [Clostridia bacterium]
MKIKQGYKLRKMCGSSIVVAVGKTASDFNGMVTLNETAELLWNRLAQGAEESDLVAYLVSEYDVDEDTATNDVKLFVEKIKGEGFIE